MADTTNSAPENPPELKPPEIKRSWGDEAEEETQEEQAAPSSSDDKSISELNVDSLTIDENKKKINKFLDEPEDSNIKAVRDLSLNSLRLYNIILSLKTSV